MHSVEDELFSVFRQRVNDSTEKDQNQEPRTRMNGCIVFILLVSALGCMAAGQKYSTKYDNIDLDEILHSDRLLKNYVSCLMERGPCTPDGEELRRVLPDALHTHCSKCNDRQRDGSKKVIRFLIKNKRQWWDELEAKYDPTHIYRTEYKEELRRDNIVF